MRLMVLTVMGLIGGLGLVAAIVAVPVMAEKGPLRTTLVADLGGGQEKVPGGGDPDGEGRAVVKVFKEQLCATVETDAIESSSKATINLGMSGEKGPTVANLDEQAAATPLPESTTPTTTTTTTGTSTTTTGTITATTGTTGTTTGTTGTTTGTTGTTTDTTGTTTGTTTATTGATGAQTGTTTSGDTTLAQATTTAQSTTVGQSSLSQSTASPRASASASASTASTSTASTSRASTSPQATILEHTGGCVEVPRALILELLEHPRRFYVNVTTEQYPEGAIRGQLDKSGAGEHRSGDVHHRSGNDDD